MDFLYLSHVKSNLQRRQAGRHFFVAAGGGAVIVIVFSCSLKAAGLTAGRNRNDPKPTRTLSEIRKSSSRRIPWPGCLSPPIALGKLASGEQATPCRDSRYSSMASLWISRDRQTHTQECQMRMELIDTVPRFVV